MANRPLKNRVVESGESLDFEGSENDLSNGQIKNSLEQQCDGSLLTPAERERLQRERWSEQSVSVNSSEASMSGTPQKIVADLLSSPSSLQSDKNDMLGAIEPDLAEKLTTHSNRKMIN